MSNSHRHVRHDADKTVLSRPAGGRCELGMTYLVECGLEACQFALARQFAGVGEQVLAGNLADRERPDPVHLLRLIVSQRRDARRQTRQRLHRLPATEPNRSAPTRTRFLHASLTSFTNGYYAGRPRS